MKSINCLQVADALESFYEEMHDDDSPCRECIQDVLDDLRRADCEWECDIDSEHEIPEDIRNSLHEEDDISDMEFESIVNNHRGHKFD